MKRSSKLILRSKLSGSLSGQLLMTAPSFPWLILFFVIPTIIIFVIAFRAPDLYGGVSKEWTLDGFKRIFNPYFGAVVWRTLWISTISTAICSVLSLPMGYYIARSSPSFQRILLLLTIVPFWSSFLIRIFAWKSLLHPEGVLKGILVYLHLASPNSSLLYHSGTVVLVTVYSFLPFAILPIYAAMVKFDFRLFEAALDLGATRLQTFFKILLPGIRVGIMSALLMVFIPALGSYVIPDLVGGTQSEMIGNKIAQRIFLERNLPEASALSALLTLAVLIPLLTVWVIRTRRSATKAPQPLTSKRLHAKAQ